jgi:FkbH-like protein
MESGNGNAAKAVNIRIAANFTVEPVEEFLTHWMSELGIPADIRFAPYNQIFQQLLEGGQLRSNAGGINLVALDLDAWLVEGPEAEAGARLAQTIEDLMGALRSTGSLGSGGCVLLFPPSPEQSPERAGKIETARRTILSGCPAIPGWSAIDLAPPAVLYGVAETRDPFTDELGNIPFTEEMYAAAATAAARWIRAATVKARKVIVLDCDNTLWRGICGEGPVEVTPPYRRLQEFMLRQQEAGVLLAIASKNNEADVMAVLESPDCALRAEHLTSWRINWEPKSENLRELAEELGLELKSFLFVDDSPYECLEVRNRYPEVLTVQLPADAEQIPAFLQHLWVFDRTGVTEEDRNRVKMYEAERQRTALSRTLTQEEFLASLQLQIQIAPAAASDLARVSQLTQRTTQFNMSGALYTEAALGTWLTESGRECWTVRVRDAFGDYGLVGALLFEPVDGAFRVSTFLLSCRALGRHVEDQMVARLREYAPERGIERLVIPVVPTVRNRPAREFLNRLCGAPVDAAEPFECVLSAASEASEWRPAEAPASAPAPAPSAQRLAIASDADTLIRIAMEVRTAEAVIAAARRTVKRRPSTVPMEEPRNPTEAAIASIWSEILGIEPVGVRDNFFDFGGHSLAATRILARAHNQFGVEMTLGNFFDAPTVEGMAAWIAGTRVAAVPAN